MIVVNDISWLFKNVNICYAVCEFSWRFVNRLVGFDVVCDLSSLFKNVNNWLILM